MAWNVSGIERMLMRSGTMTHAFFFFSSFFAVLGLELRAYTLCHSTSSFCDGLFWDRVLQTICLGCLRTVILLISASWVARITGVSHLRPAKFSFFCCCCCYPISKVINTEGGMISWKIIKKIKTSLSQKGKILKDYFMKNHWERKNTCFCFSFEIRVSLCCQSGLEFMILLPQPFECWDYNEHYDNQLGKTVVKLHCHW
jgi:hypothetical protein